MLQGGYNGEKTERRKTLKENIGGKKSSKASQSLDLPIICNMNPRSIYNKIDEFHEFVNQESVDILFLSESWERENLTLDEIINLEDHQVISNVNQRSGVGGRPAIVANKVKYDVQDVTNKLIQIPWGVEAVWCILTPKNVTHDSKIRKIACCSLYSKPDSRKKSLLLDHISDAYSILNIKYGRGLHYIIAGDTNDLNLDPILSLSPNFQQIVKSWTRMNPPAILDPILTTLSCFYQLPECLEPLDSDLDKVGKKSDHRIVIAKPINAINNKCGRQFRKVKYRPFPESGMRKMKEWFIDQTWEEVYQAESAHKKAEVFQNMLLKIMEEIFPEKERKISSDDQPWITQKLKKMDRRRRRIYHKQRRSEKWRSLDKLFKKELKSAKAQFYKKTIADLKLKNPGQWYSALKRITSNDQISQQVNIDEISHLPDQEQAEIIANKFSSIQNEYEQLRKEDITVPEHSEKDVPQFQPAQVWFHLARMKTNKATVPGDFPAILIKQFAAYLAEPLCDVINTSIRRGEYPQIYKFEISTPVPKVHPPKTTSEIRNISGLLNFDKITEKLLSELIISDMSDSVDPSQYGNQKGVSIQHYLIKMIHRILTALDNNSRKEIFAVIVNLIDWNNAFPRQCPKLGIESFMKNGVRPGLIPVLINYFQDREMTVKWHGCHSLPRKVNGGGPQGATLGLLEYLSQSNNSADMVSESDRFKFIDDLSILEIVNLLTVGLTSFNLKQQVPADIPLHNQYIPSKNLKSQDWLNQINDWTINQKMMVNERKCKTMIMNYTDNYQFTTRLEVNNQAIEVIDSTKLLGTIISNNLSWDLNIANIVRKANSRMQLLRQVASFGTSQSELKDIYILFIRSLLEQSATVWHSSLTENNISDLERIQKTAVKIMLGDKFQSYEQGLNKLDMENLSERRQNLCLSFAQKCVKNPKTMQMFPKNEKTHNMETRKPEIFRVQHANTERLRKSSIIYMQHLLNDNLD